MKSKWLVVSTGFALFSMFFGSGNLVFPITVGEGSSGHYFLASLGILLTGVIVPFLGVFGMLLYEGNIDNFFSSFGKKGTLIFSFFALALMGPFGVLARCLTVAHGAMQLLFPEVSLPFASLIMCCIIYLIAANKNHLVNLIGSWLTPVLLLSIFSIAFFGLNKGSQPETSALMGWDAFKNGFFQGYQTMDLLAAFFFSQFIISYLAKTSNPESPLVPVFCKAACIGAGILAAVYCTLVMLGWIYSPMLAGQPPQEMLGLIAMESLGPLAGPCVSVAVVFACLTTAIVLASLFADFLRTEIAKEKIGNHTALLTTLSIGLSVSTLDFAGIASFLGPILEIVYPALIALTVVNIVSKFYNFKASHWPFTLAIVAKLCTI